MSKKHKHISAVKTTEQKAVQQSQQPQELTPQKLNQLLEKNPFAQLLGMELLEVREGYAYGRMRMDEHFTNIYGGMHGGWECLPGCLHGGCREGGDAVRPLSLIHI